MDIKGILMFGTPVYSLTGVNVYFDSAAILGSCGM